MFLITGNRAALNVSSKLMMCGPKWIDQIFFKVNHIDFDLLRQQQNSKKRYIYLANHQSYMDAIIARNLAMSWQYLVTIVISYTKHIPFVGPNLWMLRIPFYDYDAGVRRKAEMKTKYLKNETTDSLSHDTLSQDTLSQDTLSQDTQDTLSQDTQDTLSQYSVSHDSMSSDFSRKEEEEENLNKINENRTGLVKMYIEYLEKNVDAVLAMFPEGKRIFTRSFKREDMRNGGFVIAKKTGMCIVPMYHNLIDRFDDVKREYNSQKKVYCLYGSPIDTVDKTIDMIKKEYYDAMIDLESKLKLKLELDR